MWDGEGSERRISFIRVIPLISLAFFFILFLIFFRVEIGGAISFLKGLFWGVIGVLTGTFQGVTGLITPETFHSFSVAIYNLLIGFGLTFLIWLHLISAQALLPVNSLEEKLQTASQLVSFILLSHGPAIFVRDGKLRASVEELHRPGPGVAVIDFNSAMVLEQVARHPGCLVALMGIIHRVQRWLLRLLGIPRKQIDAARVCGPGLTFIRPGERIQGVGDLKQESGPVESISGVVDLRSQFRLSGIQTADPPVKSGASVLAHTRDGIELGTNIWALFTIGQDVRRAPHVLQIIYDEQERLENLRVVALTEQHGTVRIQSITRDLDPADCAEIHRYFQSGPEMQPYQEIPFGRREPFYDPDRVFSAVYARARSQQAEKGVSPWYELPVRVAVDHFRELLSHVNFDELYQPDEHGTLKIDSIRKELRILMRNCGQLSYRLISHRLFYPLTPNNEYDYGDLRVSPIQSLRTPMVLRERGIQVFASGFTNLLPEKEVYRQWLASWRADWERETMTARAIADLEARRVYSRARAQAQQGLAIGLRGIFEDERHSKEAIAIRILQALESLAGDPKTQRLLPADTISMLQNIHNWLLPEDMGWG